uniref:Uncharacterized protein n=1 Tax=Dicentrarchus labrax TaxID=13489 RepID=A0A8C4NVF7_DICLA
LAVAGLPSRFPRPLPPAPAAAPSPLLFAHLRPANCLNTVTTWRRCWTPHFTWFYGRANGRANTILDGAIAQPSLTLALPMIG